MNNKRIYGIIAIIIGALLLIFIIIWIFFVKFNKPTNTNGENTVEKNQPEVKLPEAKKVTNVTSSSTVAAQPDLSATSEDKYEVSVGTVASDFVERFGTYSNQSEDDFLEKLKTITTPKMQGYLAGYAKQIASSRGDYHNYSFQTSQAVSVDVLSADDKTGKAVVRVNVKRTEEKPGVDAKVYNQSMRIELVKPGKRWKVDSATWE